MKVLVSGAAGFIGSHLCDALLDAGHTVIGIDNFFTGSKENLNPKIEFIPWDIFTADPSMLFAEQDIDWVFHEAAQCRTQVSVEDPVLNHNINITGTLLMLLAARYGKVKRFIFASSCILYSPNTPYYVSKLAGEEYCKVFSKLYCLPTVSLRYANVYGSLRQSEKGDHINAIASLHKSKRDTGRIWLTGDGQQTRDWTHVSDICRANIMAAESKVTGVYDVCTGVSTSMKTIADYFNCPIDYVPDRPGDAKHLSILQNWKPAFEDFGFKAEIPLSRESLAPYL